MLLTDKRSFTVEDVFGNFKRRQASLIKALTTDVEEFYKLCDPKKENLCLFAYSDGRWEVDLPREEIPAEFPEPVLGINFCRDEMERKHWLSFVASHSDAWMISVAFYFGARLGFDKADRERLFDMINDLPSIVEVVTAAAPKNGEIVTEAAPKNDEIVTEAAPKIEKSAVSKDEKDDSKAKIVTEAAPKIDKSAVSKDDKDDSKAKVDEEKEAEHDAAPKNDEIVFESAPKIEKSSVSKDEEDDSKAEHDETFCGACGEIYTNKTFWIACDGCDTWFHGKCVKITEARAEHIKQYKCPSCSRKKARTH